MQHLLKKNHFKRSRSNEKQAFFSFHLLGLGFWQAWWMLMLCTFLILPNSNPLNLGVSPSIWALSLTSLGLLLIIIFSDRFSELISQKSTLYGVALLSVFGTLGCAFSQNISHSASSEFFFFFCLLIATFGNAALLTMWGELWGSLATGQVIRYLFFSYTFAFILFFFIQFTPTTIAIILTSLLPAASCLVFFFARKKEKRIPAGTPYDLNPFLIGKALIFIIIAGASFGIIQSLYRSAVGRATLIQMDFLVAGICLFLLLIAAFFSKAASNPVLLYRPIIPSLTAGIILLLALPLAYAYLGNGLVIVSGYCLDMFIMLLATDIAFRSQKSVIKSFAGMIFVLRISTIFGLLITNVLISASTITTSNGVLFCSILLILSISAGTIIFTDNDLFKLYQTGVSIKTNASVEAVCEELARQHLLTERETEVFIHLASGRNVPYICKELCIAEGTARHHVGSIYRKLGVCDR